MSSSRPPNEKNATKSKLKQSIETDDSKQTLARIDAETKVEPSKIKHETKDIVCMVCGASFLRVIDLERHKKLHPPKKSTQKNKCYICNEVTETTEALIVHIGSAHNKLIKWIPKGSSSGDEKKASRVNKKVCNLPAVVEKHINKSGEKEGDVQSEHDKNLKGGRKSIGHHKINKDNQNENPPNIAIKPIEAIKNVSRLSSRHDKSIETTSHTNTVTNNKPVLLNKEVGKHLYPYKLKTSLSSYHIPKVSNKTGIPKSVNTTDLPQTTLSSDKPRFKLDTSELPLKISSVKSEQSSSIKSEISGSDSDIGAEEIIAIKKRKYSSSESDTDSTKGMNIMEKRRSNQLKLKKCLVVDGSKKYYKCSDCDYIAKYPSPLLQHLTIHTGVKKHRCDQCGKRFRLLAGLTHHVREFHMKIKPFQCESCGMCFTTKAFRDEHMNTHTDNRPFVCDICGKAFRQSGSLHVHKLFHSNVFRFECDQCDKKFRRSTELKVHKRIHTGERPYSCELCNMDFIDSKNLKLHVKVHDRSNEYLCSVCGSKFYQERYLKYHMKKYHQKLAQVVEGEEKKS